MPQKRQEVRCVETIPDPDPGRAGRADADAGKRAGPPQAGDHRGRDRTLALRAADLHRGRWGRNRRGAGHHPRHRRRPARHGPVPADPAGRLHLAGHQLRQPGAVSRLAGDQRAGADHRRGRDARRTDRRALPALRRVLAGAPGRGPAIRGRGRKLAPDGAYRGRRGLRADHRARAGISTPASSSSTRKGRRTRASSASRSWITTVRTCSS
jgi:hypothetical protein